MVGRHFGGLVGGHSISARLMLGFGLVLLLLGSVAGVGVWGVLRISEALQQTGELGRYSDALTSGQTALADARGGMSSFLVTASPVAADAAMASVDQAVAAFTQALPLAPAAGREALDGLVTQTGEFRQSIVQLRAAAEKADAVVLGRVELIGQEVAAGLAELAQSMPGLAGAPAGLADARLHSAQFLYRGERSHVMPAQLGLVKLTTALKRIGAGQDGTPEQRAQAMRLVARISEYGAAVRETVEARKELQRLHDDMAGYAARLRETAATLTRDAAERTSALRDGAVLAGERARRIDGLAALAGMLVGVLVAWAIIRALRQPMRRLSTVLGVIAGGEANVVVSDQERRDEIGAIARAVERLRGTVMRSFSQGTMLEQVPLPLLTADPREGFQITYVNDEMRGLLKRLGDSLDGDPRRAGGCTLQGLHGSIGSETVLLADADRLPHRWRAEIGEEVIDFVASAVRDTEGVYVGTMLTGLVVTEKARLADRFEADVGSVVERIAAAASQVDRAAQTVNGTARTSSTQAAAVATDAGAADQFMQSVAASAERVAASAAEIAEEVAAGAALTSEAVTVARATDASVRDLAEVTTRIDEVVRLISSITSRTNLLALNATIEAARAGEAGRGFSVVAGEVKSLAGQTARAAADISAQVVAVQRTAAAAGRDLGRIAEMVDQLHTIIGVIAAAVGRQTTASEQIARSASEVAAGTSTVLRRVGDIGQAAAGTGSAAASLLDASGQLGLQVNEVRNRSAAFLSVVRAA